MPASLQLASIDLRVPDLVRSVDFYTRQLGFVVARKSPDGVALATAPDVAPILTLTKAARSRPAPRDSAGLFHTALLFPNRAALSGWLRLAGSREVEFDGFADHGVSEAISFSDPDGNGLEFYVDRPRHPGRSSMANSPSPPNPSRSQPCSQSRRPTPPPPSPALRGATSICA